MICATKGSRAKRAGLIVVKMTVNGPTMHDILAHIIWELKSGRVVVICQLFDDKKRVFQSSKAIIREICVVIAQNASL